LLAGAFLKLESDAGSRTLEHLSKRGAIVDVGHYSEVCARDPLPRPDGTLLVSGCRHDLEVWEDPAREFRDGTLPNSLRDCEGE
jgi:hypothetical protein